MHKILIVDNHVRTIQLYTAGLEAYVGAAVTEINDLQKATDFITSQQPSIVIARSPFKDRDSGSYFMNTIAAKKLETKLIIIGNTKVSSHEATIYEANVDVRTVIRKCAQILGVTAKDMAEAEVGEYYPIKVSLLCPNLVLVCPIFRKVDGEFAQFLEKEHKVHLEVLSILKDDEHIFVMASDRLKFVNTLTVFLSEMLADDSLSLEDSVMFANQGFKLVREAARKMMITPEVIQMTENNINTMSSIVGRMPKLKELLTLTTNNTSPSFRHSLLTCYVASHIINKMEWGTQEQKVKIVFVAFFHDITLSDDNHMMIHSDEELAQLDTTAEDRESIKSHALNSAKLLNKYYSSLPFGVVTIIKQHHGTRDGIGFSAKPMSISPLAILFLVAEEWVHHILEAEKLKVSLDRKDILEKLQTKYKGVSYQAILKAIGDLSI